jgi:2-oxoglutarate ferredoxin oxidoreductase subunit alpha
VVEARHQLAAHGVATDYLRIRGLPLHPAVAEFIRRHDRVYVVEQNRDGQMENLLRQELPGELADRLRSVRHFNGVPIDAEAVSDPVLAGETAQREPAAHPGPATRRVPVG